MPTILIWPFIVLQVATVAAIILFLRMLLHKQLEMGMKRIKRLDQENLNKEVILNEKLEQLNREYEEKIKKAEEEAKILVNEAKDDIKKMRDAERLKAKEETKKIIANALREKEKVLEGAKRAVHRKAADFAAVILKRIFSESDLSALRGNVTKEIIPAVFESDKVSRLLKKNGDVEVITADKLTDEEKEHILKMIKKHGGGKEEVRFTVDEDVLGGLILKIGESIIDGGIAHRINKAAMEVKDEIG
jgi:F-type H+-transporting ATPase subunit delta